LVFGYLCVFGWYGLGDTLVQRQSGNVERKTEKKSAGLNKNKKTYI
jgi:hypothetical protein